MTVIHQEKTIEQVPIATLQRTACFYLPETEDKVWMCVEHRVHANGIDAVFVINMVTGATKELPDATLVVKAETVLVVKG